jgi:hypothetical protein
VTRFSRSFVLLALFALAGCESPITADAYQGGRKPDAQVAMVAERDATAGLQSISKDGVEVWRRKANFSEQSVRGKVTTEQVKLQPGRYKIESLLWCSSSYAYQISGFKNANYLGLRHTDEIDLAAGHVYEIRGENPGYLCNNGPKLWIEDATLGQVAQTVSSNEQTFSRP